MTTTYEDTDIIELPFEKWLRAVDRKVVGKAVIEMQS